MAMPRCGVILDVKKMKCHGRELSRNVPRPATPPLADRRERAMRTTAREREQMKAQMSASSALLLLAAARGALAAPCAFQDCSA